MKLELAAARFGSLEAQNEPELKRASQLVTPTNNNLLRKIIISI
jgi:hypothetical protein